MAANAGIMIRQKRRITASRMAGYEVGLRPCSPCIDTLQNRSSRSQITERQVASADVVLRPLECDAFFNAQNAVIHPNTRREWPISEAILLPIGADAEHLRDHLPWTRPRFAVVVPCLPPNMVCNGDILFW